MDFLLPYLWNPKEKLQKEKPKPWKRMEIQYMNFKKGQTIHYLKSRYYNNKNGLLLKSIDYNPAGEIVSTMEYNYPDNNTEISILYARGDEHSKDIYKYNEAGFLIEHHTSGFGPGDTIKYFYDDQDRLFRIEQEDDEGDKITENIEYKEGRIFKIDTMDNDGASLFRGFVYRKDGLLEKVIRMQGERVNMEQKYYYNDQNQLIKEIHESVNRIKGGKNKMMTTEFSYHPNGQLESETFSVVDTYVGLTLSTSVDRYNSDGLLIQVESMDFEEEEREVYDHSYRMLE